MLLAGAAGVLSLLPGGSVPACDFPVRDGVPAVDYHVHIGDGISVDQAIELARRRGLKFGLLQHAGAKGRGHAVSDDAELAAWVGSLDGKPVFKGIEAEDTDWTSAFSKPALARLDYVQADALGVPDASGTPMGIWKPDFRPGDPQAFMDRYLDYHVQRISTEPLDIFVVPTALPDALRADYDRLWTERRMRAIIDAAVKFRVALEIDSRFRVPSMRFLEMARDAGATFAFGSNYQTAEGLGDISYGVEAYRRLGLTLPQFFCPAPRGRKPIGRR